MKNKKLSIFLLTALISVSGTCMAYANSTSLRMAQNNRPHYHKTIYRTFHKPINDYKNVTREMKKVMEESNDEVDIDEEDIEISIENRNIKKQSSSHQKDKWGEAM